MKCQCRIVQLHHEPGADRSKEREILYCPYHALDVEAITEAFALLREAKLKGELEARRLRLLGGG